MDEADGASRAVKHNTHVALAVGDATERTYRRSDLVNRRCEMIEARPGSGPPLTT
jgi:hypothetical protein